MKLEEKALQKFESVFTEMLAIVMMRKIVLKELQKKIKKLKCLSKKRRRANI